LALFHKNSEISAHTGVNHACGDNKAIHNSLMALTAPRSLKTQAICPSKHTTPAVIRGSLTNMVGNGCNVLHACLVHERGWKHLLGGDDGAIYSCNVANLQLHRDFFVDSLMNPGRVCSIAFVLPICVFRIGTAGTLTPDSERCVAIFDRFQRVVNLSQTPRLVKGGQGEIVPGISHLLQTTRVLKQAEKNRSASSTTSAIPNHLPRV
jgi:hypothetical protein